MNRVDGYKSYIGAVLIGVASVLWSLSLIDNVAYGLIMSILVPGEISAVRHAISKTTTAREAE